MDEILVERERIDEKFQTGDVVVDMFNRYGIFIKYNPYRDDTIFLFVKHGDAYGTLESSKDNWEKVGHFGEFKEILKKLGE